MIRVVIPSQLESYTDHVREVELALPATAQGLRLADVVAGLDAAYPGMAFRIVDEQQHIRRHIAIFVGEQMVRTLDAPVPDDARVQIVGALSGG
ncbi:MAG TPA: MoaD/ThiS family protein [Rhodocyclaceae bacterium]